MRQYIIRRVLISIGVLFGVSILLYALVRSMPGDYIQTTFALSLIHISFILTASLRKAETPDSAGRAFWI